MQLRRSTILLAILSITGLGLGIATRQWLVHEYLDDGIGLRTSRICVDGRCEEIARFVDPGFATSALLVQLFGLLAMMGLAVTVALAAGDHRRPTLVAGLATATTLLLAEVAAGAFLFAQPLGDLRMMLAPGGSFWIFAISAVVGMAAALVCAAGARRQRATTSIDAWVAPTGTV